MRRSRVQMLLNSPQNSIPAYTHLFKATDCKVMFAAEPFLPVVDEILAAHTLRVIPAPSIEELLTTRHPHYAFEKTFDEARNEPLVVVHTSGTTSLPKPIVYSHDFAASIPRFNQLDPPEGYKNQNRSYQSSRLFYMLPPFHVNHLWQFLMTW